MQQKSFDQLYRMLKLINHKQINKVNIKEAIKKADKSGVLLKEEDTAEAGFDLDFDIAGGDTLDKEVSQLIKGGSDPKFYANEISSKVRGSSRNFDFPYRMYLLREPYGQIEVKINNYNSEASDNEKIEFNFDENSWIKTLRQSKVNLGTIGIPGNMTEIGKFILEFMSRIYTEKLNPIERKFESVGHSVFTSNYSKKVAEDFIRKWLDKVVFEVAKKTTKANFKDEIDEKIILSIKQPAIDFIMQKLKTLYQPERANFFAWSLELMKNIIKNQFKKFGKRNVENTSLLVDYFDSLTYPYKIATTKEFNSLIKHKFGTSNLSPEQWVELKELSNTNFDGVPEIINDSYVFTYNSPEDIINDILSANKESKSDEYVTLSPLYVRNIKNDSIKDLIFKSDLKPGGEEKHENTGKVTISIDREKGKSATIIFDKSKFESENPSKSITNISFSKNVSDEEKETWKQNMVDDNWSKFVEEYDKDKERDNAILRSKGLSTVDNSVDSEEETDTTNEDSFEINILNPTSKDYTDLLKKIKKLKEESEKATRNKKYDLARKANRTIKILEELKGLQNVIKIDYKITPKFKDSPSELEITSVTNSDGEKVNVSNDLMNYLELRAKQQLKNKASRGEVTPSELGGSEDNTFEDEGENRLERFKKIMGTPKFIQKFIDTISETEDGEGIADRFRSATINKINELKTLKDKKVIIEFYSFLGDLIAESILAVAKPSTKGAKPKVPGIDVEKTNSNSGEIQENMIDIYEKAYENHIEKLSKHISEEELNKAKEYFKLNPDNLKRLAAAINTFMYASSKNKKSNFANMGLDEAKKILSSLLKKTIKENMFNENEIELDEERISNEEGATKVNQKENFIGSQVFGEDIGDVGKNSDWKEGLYGVFSYGEQFPIYIYTNMPFQDQDGNTKNKDGKFRWFHNIEEYKFDIDKDGEKEVMKSVEKHKELLKPKAPTHGLTTATLENLVHSFKKKYGIKELSHVSILPGEGEGIHYGAGGKDKK